MLDNDGLYWLGKDQKLHSIREHPQLNRFAGMEVWTMMQDSKGRFWYAFDEKGLGFYDPKTGKTEFWAAGTSNTEGSQTMVGSIRIDKKEDKKGLIWVSSFAGLTRIDYEKKIFKIHRHNSLKGASFALHVDPLDRLWVSTGNELILLDSSRTQFSKFGISDGLPSLEFTEEGSYQTASGKVILPTFNGFVQFNPLDYATQKQPLDFYGTSFITNNIEHTIPNTMYQDKLKVALGSDENTFQFNLVALNYLNNAQTWYAYKLDGLDKDWNNIIDDESPLKISIYTEGGYLVVKNNLQRKKFVEGSNKRGLTSLASLYGYFSERPVEIIENQDSFTIKMPLI